MLFKIVMHEEKINRLHEMKKKAEMGGGEERIEAQHTKGKLTARERLDLLLDSNSFIEIDKYVVHRSIDSDTAKYYGDGVITGFGTINGRKVFVYAYDFTILGGSLGEMAGRKIVKLMDHAIKVGDDFCNENLFNTNIVVPIDLIFLDPHEIELLLSMSSKLSKCSIIVPSTRMDGTNLLIRRPFNLYETSYDNDSYYNHIQSSKKTCARTIIVKSINLSEDLDTMDDYNSIITHPINRLAHLVLRIRNIT